MKIDQKAWETRLRSITRPFAAHPEIDSGTATLEATNQTRWYLNTEGTTIQTSQPIYDLRLSASTTAEDGTSLPFSKTFDAFTLEGLPDEAALQKVVEQMIADLTAMRNAGRPACCSRSRSNAASPGTRSNTTSTFAPLIQTRTDLRTCTNLTSETTSTGRCCRRDSPYAPTRR